jgi:hypothetical protein
VGEGEGGRAGEGRRERRGRDGSLLCIFADTDDVPNPSNSKSMKIQIFERMVDCYARLGRLDSLFELLQQADISFLILPLFLLSLLFHPPLSSPSCLLLILLPNSTQSLITTRTRTKRERRTSYFCKQSTTCVT